MFDIRYHIISLVAVFLALTIGILLGSVIVDKGVLVKQQKALVESLEARQNDLQENNRLITQENNSLKKFQDEALSVIDGKLKDKRIAVIVTTDVLEADRSDLAKSLEQAGARTSFLDTSTFLKNFKNEATRKKLANFFPETDLSKDDLKAKVFEKVATEISAPSDKAFLSELSKLELIDSQGMEDLPVEQVIFFGGTQSTKSNIAELDIPLIQQLKGLGMRIIGVEESEAKTSYIETYQQEGISTVDNIDQVPGKIALVYVLLGQDGRFGIKSSAEKILPSLNQSPND